MDTKVPTPFPLIHVDLNHEPGEFFFTDHTDKYQLAARYKELSQPNSVEKMIIEGGGSHNHLLNEDFVDGKNRINGHDHDHDHGVPQDYCPVKWTSWKTRIMKKMTGRTKPSVIRDLGSDQNHKASSGIPSRSVVVLENDTSSSANSNKSSGSWIESSQNNSNPTIIRVCTDCNTTKTPLWRSGPTGPKSLCNACGIRQRKARRALAANVESPPQPNPSPTKFQQKKAMKKPASSIDNDPRPMQKLKSLDPPVCSGNLCIEDFVMKSSEWISAFRGVFPQDEKEAAILLMALSYGLVKTDNLST